MGIMNYANALAMCGATLIGAVAIISAAAPVRADPSPKLTIIGRSPETVTRNVNYADLNLASSDGLRTLNGRVDSAVNTVCAEAVGSQDYFTMQDCAVHSWGGARPQIARAVQRAHEIAATGSSSIAAAAITIDLTR